MCNIYRNAALISKGNTQKEEERYVEQSGQQMFASTVDGREGS